MDGNTDPQWHLQRMDGNQDETFRAMKGSKTILLTGAPLSTSLDWREDTLCASLEPCYSQGDKQPYTSDLKVDILPNVPAWRTVQLEGNHLSIGLIKASKADEEPELTDEASFVTSGQVSFISSSPEESFQVSSYVQNELLSQYYEHSFAVHEEIPSSQIVSSDSPTTSSFSTSYEDTSLLSSSSASFAFGNRVPRAGLAFGRVIDLRDMPNATYIRSIEPQTMTINLIVGIISISQPRLIITRKGGRRVDLTEMLVGDDTKAGFGINFWLHPQTVSSEGCDMRSAVTKLRPQDIVLLRNVALGSFRGKVYGQSLRKNTTTLDLLYRSPLDVNDPQGFYSARELEGESAQDTHTAKVANVKQWVMTFVGGGTDPKLHAARNRLQESQEMHKGHLITLPPDTQP